MVAHNIQSISTSRLSPYVKLCKGDNIHAICVYTSLQHRAALYFTVIQEIEIAFRNELSGKIEDWLLHSPNSPQITLYEFFKNHMIAYLSKEGQSQLQKALNDVQLNYSNKLRKAQKPKQVRAPDHNDIISHLTFGFWVHLLEQDPQKNPHYQYWDSILVDLFQNRFGTNLNLFTRMKDVLRFRNNLYHQEAVWKNKNITTPEKALRNLQKKFTNFLNHLQMLSPQRFLIIDKSYEINNLRETMFDLNNFAAEVNLLKKALSSQSTN